MKHLLRIFALAPFLIASVGAAHAASYQDTIAVFKKAGASGGAMPTLSSRQSDRAPSVWAALMARDESMYTASTRET